jgi:hypothetical protein
MTKFRMLTAALVAVGLLAIPASAPAATGIKLKPTAGRFGPGPRYQPQGNSTDAQAQWTNKVALDGKFSVLLQKSAPTSDFSYAAAIVDGTEGLTVAQLGTIGFSVNGPCGAGSPRFNLFYDNNGDGQYDGYAFYGCANHFAGSPAPGWTSMSAVATAPDFVVGQPITPASVVVQLSVIADEQGTYYIDRVQAAGQTTGEPNGGN